jgi:hypothetical protein
MWLSGLHIPETYIAALVQAACRDKGWPLDKSTLYTKVRSLEGREGAAGATARGGKIQAAKGWFSALAALSSFPVSTLNQRCVHPCLLMAILNSVPFSHAACAITHRRPPPTSPTCLSPSSSQTHTYKHPPHSLLLQVTKFTEPVQISERPKYGCYVSGLYLEGAGWDPERSQLVKQDPKVLVTELPILQIIPVEANKLKLANTFRWVAAGWCSVSRWGSVAEAGAVGQCR